MQGARVQGYAIAISCCTSRRAYKPVRQCRAPSSQPPRDRPCNQRRLPAASETFLAARCCHILGKNTEYVADHLGYHDTLTSPRLHQPVLGEPDAASS